MDRELLEILKKSNIKSENYSEVDRILHQLLNTKYKENVVIERLLHQANFDKDVFMKHFKQRLACEGPSCCERADNQRVKTTGYDPTSMFGVWLVTITDFWFDNHPLAKKNLNKEFIPSEMVKLTNQYLEDGDNFTDYNNCCNEIVIDQRFKVVWVNRNEIK